MAARLLPRVPIEVIDPKRPWADAIGDRRFETETVWKEKLTGGTRSAVEILARELRQGLSA